MTEPDLTETQSPLLQPEEASPDTTTKTPITQSKEGISTHNQLLTNELNVEAVTNNASCFQMADSLFDELASELRKLIHAISSLKANSNGNRFITLGLRAVLVCQKETSQLAAQLASGSLLSNSPPPKPQSASPHSPVKLRIPQLRSPGPFIRLVTCGLTTLVHFGQLVGIVENHCAFLLKHVVSFNPDRANLQVISQLKPSDIIYLTESKRQDSMQAEEQRSRRVNLLSPVIPTTDKLETVNRLADCDMESSEASDIFGPCIITPGFVLIRSDRVRELGLLEPEPDSSLNAKLWDLVKSNVNGFERLHHWERFQLLLQQQQQQRTNIPTSVGKSSTTSGANRFSPCSCGNSSSPGVNVVLGNEHVTPINRAGRSENESKSQVGNLAENVKEIGTNAFQTAEHDEEASTATTAEASTSTAATAVAADTAAQTKEGKTAEKASGETENRENTPGKEQKPSRRRRGGRRRRTNNGEQNGTTKTSPKDVRTANSANRPKSNRCIHPIWYDTAIAALPKWQLPLIYNNCDSRQHMGCACGRPTFAPPNRRRRWLVYQPRWRRFNYCY